MTKIGNVSKFSGVIPEEEYAASNPMRQLAREILGGRRDQYSTSEIQGIVDKRYFGFNPLVSLNEKEDALLRDDMVKTLQDSFNEGVCRQLFESVCYISGDRQNVYTGKTIKKAKNVPGLHRMTDQEKIALMEDPANLDVRWYQDNFSHPFSKMGYRNFNEYPMSEKFAKLVRRLQKVQGRQNLHVLDLGGGVGLALHDIKRKHPELVTYNATRDEEFSHYPADFHVVAFMERMPLALQGKIDIIFSNMMTRYLAYTDLVIEGCVAMLAKGGIMEIFFSSDRSDNHEKDDVQRRMKRAYDFLKDLENFGAIKLEIDSSFTSNVGGSFQSDEKTLYPAANVFVKKL